MKSILFIIIVFFKCFCADYRCSSSGEIKYVTSNGVWYCYKNLGIYKSGIESVSRTGCVEWNPNAHLVTIFESDELQFVIDDVASGLIHAWIGLYKTEIFLQYGDLTCSSANDCTPDSACCPETEDRYRWADTTPISWFLGYYGKCPNDDVYDCRDRDNWCHAIEKSSYLIRNVMCTSRSKEGICKYRIPVCDVPGFDVSVCSGHGDCLENRDGADECVCDFLYTGTYCNLTYSCGGIRHDNMTVCSGQGNCTEQDSCVCESGFFGEQCEFPSEIENQCSSSGDIVRQNETDHSCYHKFVSNGTFDFFSAEKKCQEWGGHLISFDNGEDEVWARSEFGYFMTGLKKRNPIFPEPWEWMVPCPLPQGYIWTDKSVNNAYAVQSLSDRLHCDGQNEKCFGIKQDQGLYWDDMSCLDKTLDFVCKKPLLFCNDENPMSEEVCSGRGICSGGDDKKEDAFGVCHCQDGYYGKACEWFDCFGVRYDSKTDLVCSGRGICIGPNSCKCEQGTGGKKCENAICNGIASTEEGMVCSGHGTCLNHNDCRCEFRWGGAWCDSFFPPNENVEPYLIKTWTPVLTGNPFHYSGLGRVSLYHMHRYPLQVAQWEDYEVDKFLDFFECEEKANQEWYPGRGHLFSIQSSEQASFSLSQRQSYLFPQDNRIFDQWVGYYKKYEENSDIDRSCDNVGYLGDFWTDGSSNDYFTNNEVATCGNEVLCYRQMKNGNLDDYWCVAPRPCLFHYLLRYCYDKPLEEGGSLVLSNDVSVCMKNGMCWDDEICSCWEGVNTKMSGYSSICGIVYCNGVMSNSTSVCSGQGDCFYSDNGICTCDDNWFGKDCNVTKCNGTFSNETSAIGSLQCNGHGKCVESEKCHCEDEYYGKYCEFGACDNNQQEYYTSVCSGHGECLSSLGYCNCSENYSGKFCEFFYCYGVRKDRDWLSPCSAHGKCVGVDRCECDEHYHGKICNETQCNGIWNNRTGEYCSNRGICREYDACECKPDVYFGKSCNISECFGFFSNETDKVCHSSRGECVDENKCVCKTGYFGPQCNISFCFDYFTNDTENVCSGHGDCVDTDKCICFENSNIPFNYSENEQHAIGSFGGTKCELHKVFLNSDHFESLKRSEIYCDEIVSFSSKVCSGHGNCVNVDVCECEENYFGTYCNATVCHGIFSNETNDQNNEKICSGHGKCVGFDACECYFRHHGEMCNVTECYGVLSDEFSACGEHGKCESIENCVCDEGYFGEICNIPLSSLQVGSGNEDQDQDSSSSSSASATEAGTVAGSIGGSILLVVVVLIVVGVCLCCCLGVIIIFVVIVALFFVLGGGGLLMGSPWFISVIGFFGIKVGKGAVKSKSGESTSREEQIFEQENEEEFELGKIGEMEIPSSSSSSSDEEIDLPPLMIINKSLKNVGSLQLGEEIVEEKLPVKRKKKKKKKKKKKSEKEIELKDAKYLNLIQGSLNLLSFDKTEEEEDEIRKVEENKEEEEENENEMKEKKSQAKSTTQEDEEEEEESDDLESMNLLETVLSDQMSKEATEETQEQSNLPEMEEQIKSEELNEILEPKETEEEDKPNKKELQPDSTNIIDTKVDAFADF